MLNLSLSRQSLQEPLAYFVGTVLVRQYADAVRRNQSGAGKTSGSPKRAALAAYLTFRSMQTAAKLAGSRSNAQIRQAAKRGCKSRTVRLCLCTCVPLKSLYKVARNAHCRPYEQRAKTSILTRILASGCKLESTSSQMLLVSLSDPEVPQQQASRAFQQSAAGSLGH